MARIVSNAQMPAIAPFRLVRGTGRNEKKDAKRTHLPASLEFVQRGDWTRPAGVRIVSRATPVRKRPWFPGARMLPYGRCSV